MIVNNYTQIHLNFYYSESYCNKFINMTLGMLARLSFGKGEIGLSSRATVSLFHKFDVTDSRR